MSGGLDVPRSTCHRARHLATTAMEEDIRRTQQQSVPPQVPQVGRAGGETGASPSIRRPMLAASVVEAKKDKQGHFAVACPESVMAGFAEAGGISESLPRSALCREEWPA